MHFKGKVLIIVVGTKHGAFSDFQDILVLWYVSFEETYNNFSPKIGIVSLKYHPLLHIYLFLSVLRLNLFTTKFTLLDVVC